MRPISILALCLALVVQEFHAVAQVPHVMTYQGRVASGGTNFSGTGQFKFALVSGGTSAAARASGAATVSFGFIVQIANTGGGAGYTAAPTVTITDSSGSGASAIAQIANGQVTGITVTDAGSGYSASPSITIAPPAANVSYTTYWSHDGTSSAGGEPVSVVPVSVVQGLFTVGLGDTTIPNMSALPPQVLANADVRLRMWFNDGVNGFSQLSPDQRLTSAAYAMMADTVRDGAITSAKLAPNSITSAQIAPGSITVSQLADGAVTSAKLAANVNLGPPSGTVAISTNANDTNLTAAGYVKIADAHVTKDEWTVKPSLPVVDDGTIQGAMVWTGTEVLTFGWVPSFQGERYSPTTNLRRLTAATAAPPNFEITKAVWTGTEAIIWGSTNYFQYGVGYNPTTDSWRRLAMPNSLTNLYADSSRISVVWTGSELIVWGDGRNNVATGVKYNPALETWTPMPSPVPSGFYSGYPTYPAVWTGSEMIVFGQEDARHQRYNPTSNTWQMISQDGAPSDLYGQGQAVWTGTEVIYFRFGNDIPWGAIYDPTRDSWRSMNLGGLSTMASYQWMPSGWTRTSMEFIKFYDVDSGFGPSTRSYDPATDLWKFGHSPIPSEESERDLLLSVWTGRERLYRSVRRGSLFYSFIPAQALYLYQKQ